MLQTAFYLVAFALRLHYEPVLGAAAKKYVDVCEGKANAIDPDLEWGAYTSITKEQKTAFMDKIYHKIPEEVTECKSPSDFQLSRHYKNLHNSDDQIFSYYCAEANPRGFEHIRANMKPGEEKYTKWADKLSTFGIEGKGFPELKEVSNEEMKEMKEYVRPLLDLIESQIPKDLCDNVGLETVFNLQQKDENNLHYWKFPVSCGDENQERIDMEIVQDTNNCAIHGGRPVLVYRSDVTMGNRLYLEAMKAEMPDSELQRGDSHLLALSPLALTIPLALLKLQLL